MKTRYSFWITFVVLIIVTSGCNNKKIKSKALIPPTLVRIAEIKKELTYDRMNLVGQLHGIKEITIFPGISVSGLVKNKKVNEGSYVKKGQSLMEIDQQAVTGNTYMRFVVRAKMSGTVSEVYVENGDLVTPQSKLCKIIQMKKVKVEVGIPEKQIAKVKKGQKVLIFLQSYPNDEFTGVLSRLHPSLDPNTLTLKGEVTIDNPNNKLKPGMFAQVKVLLKEKTAILIPISSLILEDNNIRYVYIYNPDTQKVHQRRVRTGETYRDKIEVIKGLKEKDKLVIEGHYQVTDQEKVKVLNEAKLP